MLFVAHRGESKAAPENTLESFSLAWQRGATTIESDFHLSKDKHVICMHDDNALRTCGIDRPLAEMTLAEIRTLDAGIFKGNAWKNTRVPTLDEVLAQMPGCGRIYLELKCAGEILEQIQEVLLRLNFSPERISFIAFNEEVISEAKKHYPTSPAYWLTNNENDAKTGPCFSPAELAEKLHYLQIDGVDILDRHITQEYVETLHKKGFSFHVWTVDQPECARRLIDWKVDSITTNRRYALIHEL